MSKLEETNMLIDFLTTEMKKNPGLNVAKSAEAAIFTDIAKSLAMIADKLCEIESEDKT